MSPDSEHHLNVAVLRDLLVQCFNWEDLKLIRTDLALNEVLISDGTSILGYAQRLIDDCTHLSQITELLELAKKQRDNVDWDSVWLASPSHSHDVVSASKRVTRMSDNVLEQIEQYASLLSSSSSIPRRTLVRLQDSISTWTDALDNFGWQVDSLPDNDRLLGNRLKLQHHVRLAKQYARHAAELSLQLERRRAISRSGAGTPESLAQELRQLHDVVSRAVKEISALDVGH